MRRFSKIKKFIPFFNIKTLIIIVLTLSTLLITYFSYFKYKDLIVEQLALNKERLLFGFNNDTAPNLIILGNNYIDTAIRRGANVIVTEKWITKRKKI